MEFDFKIRDELLKTPEYDSLSKKLSLIDSSGIVADRAKEVKNVSIHMIIDIMVFCAEKDIRLAMNFLRITHEFVQKCLLFLRESFPSNEQRCAFWTKYFLKEVWSYGFVLKSLRHQFKDKLPIIDRHPTDILRDVIVKMNEENLLAIAGNVGDYGRRNYVIIRREIMYYEKKKDKYNIQYRNLLNLLK